MWIPPTVAPFLLPSQFRGYRPQAVTRDSINRWLDQFDRADRGALIHLLKHVVYFDQADVEKIIVEHNEKLLSQLAKAGIPPEQVIYVQIDDAGSSSPVMLNLLRDKGRLLQRSCRLIDGRDTLRLNEATAELGTGAIVYVDDFSGTGDQFSAAHIFASQFIVGAFSEFYLAPCICEEGMITIARLGVEPFPKRIHAKDDRPLHPNCTRFDARTKDKLVGLAHSIDPEEGLGYAGLATMVVFSHNAPDTVPLLLRGSIGQDPFCGVFPRWTDKPHAEA